MVNVNLLFLKKRQLSPAELRVRRRIWASKYEKRVQPRDQVPPALFISSCHVNPADSERDPGRGGGESRSAGSSVASLFHR